MKSTFFPRIFPFLAFLGFFVAPFSAFSKHIIGGEITYEYVETLPSGEKVWRFTMHVYRDCGASMAADLDEPAEMAIYREQGAGMVLVDTFRVPERNGGNGMVIPPDLSSPCLDAPPSVCVEEGFYTFTATLPVLTSGSYHIVYQRCCRNQSITNIVNPGDFGATYTVELTALAQSLDNSSPTFTNFPPIVICMDFPINFDHSAVDADGDGVEYRFFTPFHGGGNITTPDVILFSCEGAKPTPPCPPPFDQVTFLAPYTQNAPMGGNPVISINQSTGLITGEPDLQGQFVVGIEVVERRNGQIISIIRREFQFNATPCTPQVLADIKEDSLSLGGIFKVISCGTATVKVVNESTVRSNIDEFYWIFNYKNGQRDSIAGNQNSPDNLWSPTVTFPDTGDYKGILVLNPNTPCEDSAEVIFKIRPDIRADFAFAQDSCASGRVLFSDKSFSGGAPIQYWFWEFGDGADTSRLLKNPVHIYQGPANSTAQLVAVDTSGCRDTVRYEVPFVQFPKLAAFDFSPTELNTLQKTADFVDQSSNPVKWKWQFGAVGGSSLQNPSFTFPDTGAYRVNLFIVDDRGCEDSTSRILDVKPLVIWHMPNAFTPNGDGSNDEFFGKGYIVGSSDFSMTIWNRYGEKIFETSDPERGWNGRKNGSGEVLPNGVYVFLVTFKGPRGDLFEQKGYATIVR